MSNYGNYIELAPDYESVIDIDSDTRRPDMWKNYIVNDDMKKTVAAICDSLEYADADKRRSFWIHGAYGTGKSYAAIVLKHLFEDDEKSVHEFFSKQILIPYRERFLSLRHGKGKFLVIFKSQTDDLKSGIQLMMTMETAIRTQLKNKFGDSAHYGKTSLVAAAKEAVNDSSINWNEIFMNPAYALCKKYNSVEDFRAQVMAGNLKAVGAVASIYRDKGWGFFTTLQMFKDWLKDIIKENHLEKGGIIFIWDEFTSYLHNNPTDDVLQSLSEFCKEQPFFMFLIVHRSPGWLSQIGEEIYERIIHRYHSLDFHISETAVYDLIGNLIIAREGMEIQWRTLQDELIKSIDKNFADLDNADVSNKKEQIRNLCPLHPMTLSLLALIAQNFGASQRSIFRFMKDSKESEQNVGFIHYINHYGPNDWHWLTADFLWDYFFTRESDVRNFSSEAKDAYQHYMTKKDLISDETHMHIFKAAMLLIAVTSYGATGNLYSRAIQRRFSATRSTLYKCFAGQLNKEDVDKYLADLEQIGVLRLDAMTNGDVRLQIPYVGNVDVFDARKNILKKKYTRHELFKRNGIFSGAVESKIWNRDNASFGRIVIAACDVGTISIKLRFNELQTELNRFPYKFGILVIVLEKANQFAAMRDKIKNLAAQDETGRMAVYLLKSPLTEENLDRWYNAVTHSELAAEEGKNTDAERYGDESNVIIEEWTTSAVEGNFTVVCGDKIYSSVRNANSFSAKLEREILFGEIFTAAPELIVSTNTAFKKIQQSTALAGIKKTVPNAQLGNIAKALKQAGVWDIEGLNNLAKSTGNSAAETVALTAEFLLQRFSQGTQIKLESLWQELQAAPFGYYNNMACGYILGFLLREYVNSEFTWNKGDNNSWALTEQTLATLIAAMCREEVINNYLSPGSETWRKFKPYVQKIFNLQDGEAVNETEARKYISKQCTEKAGAPFWVLKYVSAEKFGSIDEKNIADGIINLLCDFMNENGDSEKIMENITNKFKGHGNIRQILTNLYFDRNTLYDALSSFIFLKCAELRDLKQKIGLTDNAIFDSIRQLLQGQISTWTETQVEEKLNELCLEYRAVAVLNDALNLNRKSLNELSIEIANAFSRMKVPGSVIEKLDYDWIPTLKILQRLSSSDWSKLTLSEKKTYTQLLTDNAHKVWNTLAAPKIILQRYMEKNGHHCTEEELNTIYNSLQPAPYDSSPSDFDFRIETQLNNATYNRNKKRLLELWKNRSGFESVELWCANFSVPIQWVVGDEVLPHVIVLKNLEDNKITDNTALQNAVKFFESHTISALKDRKFIKDCFIAQLGESYRIPFDMFGDLLIDCLKADANLTANVYLWANKVGEIRKIVDAVLRDKCCAEAMKNINKMTKAKLYDKVVKLLEENPDLYTLFID